MGASAAIMGGAQLVSSFAGAYASAEADRAQGEYQKTQFDINANFAKLQAENSIKIGDKKANEVMAEAERFVGSQRAILAAQGIDVNVGSAVDVQEETRVRAEVAAMSIKNNAWREAWGLKVDASNNTYKGAFAQMAGENKANSTLLTAGIGAVGTAYKVGAGGMRGGGGKTTWDGGSWEPDW